MTTSAIWPSERVAPRLIADATRDILETGFAVVTLPEDHAEVMAAALDAGRAFFAKPQDDKARYGSDDNNYGYRPLGVEYSATPDRPDLNDCFAMWSNRLDLIPNSEELSEFTDALLSWRDLGGALVAGVLDSLAAHFGAATAPTFSAASNLQLNNYCDSTSDRELLQDKHEDGHMITAIHATLPGLERFVGDVATSATTADNELILMPGSLLTRLSGGEIPPLYHQVRNLRVVGRMSLMYFVNPELYEPVMTWRSENGEPPVDLREIARANPLPFGLAPLREL